MAIDYQSINFLLNVPILSRLRYSIVQFKKSLTEQTELAELAELQEKNSKSVNFYYSDS